MPVCQLSYHAPCGAPISREEWFSLYTRMPSPGRLCFAAGPFEAELSWVGVASSREARPGLWLVRAWEVVRRPEGDGARTRRVPLPGLDSWHETRREALAAWKQALRQLKGMAEAQRGA